MKILRREEVCRCGNKLSSTIINGFQCLKCNSLLDNNTCTYAHYPYEKVIPIAKPQQFVECTRCIRRYPYPLANNVCKKCGTRCIKQNITGNGYFYYCPNCDREVTDLIKNCGIPKDYLQKELNGMEPNKLNPALIQHIENVFDYPRLIRTWVVIKGPTGSGKTTFAAILAKSLMRRLLSVRFVHLPQYLKECREMMDFKNPERPELRMKHEELINSRILLIDDLYTKKYTDFEKTQVYELIWRRDAQGLPTIITTQQSYTELEASLDEQTASRIRGRAKFFISGDSNERRQPE